MSTTDSPLGSGSKSHREEEDREAESILEAIEVGSTHNEKSSSNEFEDVEKQYSSQTSKPGHDPATTTAVLDWTGPDDPGNPQNWSRWKRSYHFWPVRYLTSTVQR